MLRVQEGETKSGNGTAHHARQEPGAGSTYSVPTGGGFDWVSSPHYLGEIFIYVGLAIVCRGQAMTLLVLAWVVCPGFANCSSSETLHVCLPFKCILVQNVD